jgi:lipoate-protein ligase A
MTPIPCLILPHQTLDGPSNMAFDEALLDSVDADPSHAILRTYQWARPTLSLGYFQRIGDVEGDPRWRGADVVRRPTGGGAIWHHHDLTYAIVLPGTHPAYAQPRALYRSVHGAIASALRQLGVRATRRGEPISKIQAKRPFLCFTDQDSEDIVIGDVKIVGSSQRRRPGAVLQHGSVLLARSTTTPELPGLDEFTETPVSLADLAAAVRDAIPIPLTLAPIQSADVARWASMRKPLETRYVSRDWTARR